MIHTRLLKWVNEAGVFRKGGRGKFKQKSKGKIDLIKKGGGNLYMTRSMVLGMVKL